MSGMWTADDVKTSLNGLKRAETAPRSFIYLFIAFLSGASMSCLRASTPSSSTVWALVGSSGRVAALSGLSGGITETEGSNSREPLSLISDSMGTVESPAVPSWRPELGSTAPEPDWWRKKNQEKQNETEGKISNKSTFNMSDWRG